MLLKDPVTNIFLTGFMATGKSSIGRILAKILKWKHYDLDTLIEKQKNKKISAIFKEDGEEQFRQYELEAMQILKNKKCCIISLGGGTLTQKKNQDFIEKNGLLICFESNPKTILKRVNRQKNRPLINAIPAKKRLSFIQNLLEERAPFYNSAKIFIKTDNDQSQQNIAETLLQKISLYQSASIHVKLPHHSYPIYIEDPLLNENLLEKELLKITQNNLCPSHYFLIVDSQIQFHYPELVKKICQQLYNANIFVLEANESLKNLETVQSIITQLLQEKLPRKSTLVALGGGIIGDITGFVSSIYLRGIPFIQIPTTLLSMIDSSIGGKTGVNHPLGKNLIGSFYQPQVVISDLNLLKTLPTEQYLAGLGEVIKYSMIWDSEFFNFLKKNSKHILAQDVSVLKKVVQKCCEIKAEIVQLDEKEQNLRMILNYGHTFAHAIELMQGYNTIPHGLAVALGMRVAGRVATLIKAWTEKEEQQQTELLDLFNLPKTFKIDKKKAWESILIDKKVNENKEPIFIIPVQIGKVIKDSNIDKETINQAWSILEE